MIDNNRSDASVTQLSRIMFHDETLEDTLSFSNATATSNPEGNTNEKANKLIDLSTSTKLCISNYTPSSSNPIIIIIDLQTNVDFSHYNIWEWWTANDHSERDPITFKLYLSKDGTSYTLVDSADSISPTTNRTSLGYSGNITF